MAERLAPYRLRLLSEERVFAHNRGNEGIVFRPRFQVRSSQGRSRGQTREFEQGRGEILDGVYRGCLRNYGMVPTEKIK
jgi:hypothetical protein